MVIELIEVIKERFWAKVNKTHDCWEWMGSKYTNGYGQININKRNCSAHRLSYLINVGEISGGMHVLHDCDNRGCVNPNHLKLGTRSDNMQDAARKKRLGFGETHQNAKLSEVAVYEIKKKLKEGLSQRLIAEEYNVCQAQISRINRGLRWGHLGA